MELTRRRFIGSIALGAAAGRLGWAAAQGGTSPQDDPYYAFTWSPVPEECRRLTHMVWFRKDSDPAEVAEDSLTRPVGRRALFSWDMHRELLRNPEDVCRTAAGEPTTFQGVWPEKGIEAVAALFDDFFRRFKEAGGEADWLIIDFEDNYSNWVLGGADKIEHWRAIQNDPRSAGLAQKLGFADLTTVADWRGKRDYLKWNAVMAGVVSDAVHRALFEPARKHFPGLRCSNYGADATNEQNVVPDLNGHLQWSEGRPPGTHQAPSFYTWINQLANVKLDGKEPFAATPFNGLLLSVNGIRAMRRSSDMPLQPWVAWARYKGDGPGLPPATCGETPYYNELVYHLGLSGIDGFLFWNPHPWAQGQDPKTMSMPDDERLLDRLLGELHDRVGRPRGEALAPIALPWDAPVVATGMRAGNEVLWRITFRPDTESLPATLGGEAVTLKPEAGGVGMWLRHDAGKRLVIEGTGGALELGQ
jgi:hypothetical protein